MLRSIILSALAGVILSLPFSNGLLWLFAWIGFLPLFLALDKNPARPFFLFYIAGVAFWASTVYWLVHVTLPGTAVLVLYLALYFGILGLFVSKIKVKGASRLLFIPALWVLLEYIRSHFLTGFPWALLGYSQCRNLPVIQVADITGAYGVSFLVVMVNVALWELLRFRTNDERRTPNDKPVKIAIIAALIFIAALGYGLFRLRSLSSKPVGPFLKVSVIQGNIPQDMKWVPGTREFILSRYSQLSEQAAQEKPGLIVWPEAASPGFLGEHPLIFDEIFALSKKIKIPLLLGSVARDKEEYFNSALFIEEGKVSGRYDKLHLVPFGEYIPLKKLLPFLETVVPIGEISPGVKNTVFMAGKAPFSVLICFEDAFPELSRLSVKGGAGFLVNITNDAWYMRTSAAYQHLQASIFRALENRVYLARSANTGISAFISSEGRVISLVEGRTGEQIFIEGFRSLDVPVSRGALSFYTKYGDVLIFACLLFVLYVIISHRKNKK